MSLFYLGHLIRFGYLGYLGYLGHLVLLLQISLEPDRPPCLTLMEVIVVVVVVVVVIVFATVVEAGIGMEVGLFVQYRESLARSLDLIRLAPHFALIALCFLPEEQCKSLDNARRHNKGRKEGRRVKRMRREK